MKTGIIDCDRCAKNIPLDTPKGYVKLTIENIDFLEDLHFCDHVCLTDHMMEKTGKNVSRET